MLKLKIKKLDPELPTPTYAHEGDAAFDLYAREAMKIAPGERALIPTGLALAIPVGYVGLIWDKSGLSNKCGLKTLGGVVDAGYRGEVMVGLHNLSNKSYACERSDKIAQMLIQKVEQVELTAVDELGDTARGEGGFGSSGK